MSLRDHLRVHPDTKAAYERLKKDLLSSFDQDNSPFANYTLRKGTFIRIFLRKTSFEAWRILHCTQPSQWQADRAFRTG